MLVAERLPIVKPNLNTGTGIRRKTRIRLKRAILVKICGVLIGLVFLNSIIQALVVQKNYQIVAKSKEIQSLDRELNKIQIEMAGLTSYDRIQYLAKTELGMKLATPRDYRRIAAVSSIDQTTSSSYQQGVWGRFAGWVGGVGRTLANTP